MPNCFSLTRKGEATPTPLQEIDRELCQNLDLPYDDLEYTCEWYSIIGFALAMGGTLNQIVETLEPGSNRYRIAAYLNEHFTSDAWAERSF